MGPEAPTAVVCDDAPGFRALMTALLEESGLRVIGDCGTWAEAECLAPGVDVVVVDLWMPELDMAALARVRASVPDATLAVVTALSLDDAARHVADIGVDLLLAKFAPPAEVAGAIVAHCRARSAPL